MTNLFKRAKKDSPSKLDMGAKIAPSYKKEILPAGEPRIVHVNPRAIAFNDDDDHYPTVVVVDSRGKSKAYHAVVVRGDIALRSQPSGKKPKGVNASVFIETLGEIEVYTNPEGTTDSPPRGCG